MIPREWILAKFLHSLTQLAVRASGKISEFLIEKEKEVERREWRREKQSRVWEGRSKWPAVCPDSRHLQPYRIASSWGWPVFIDMFLMKRLQQKWYKAISKIRLPKNAASAMSALCPCLRVLALGEASCHVTSSPRESLRRLETQVCGPTREDPSPASSQVSGHGRGSLPFEPRDDSSPCQPLDCSLVGDPEPGAQIYINTDPYRNWLTWQGPLEVPWSAAWELRTREARGVIQFKFEGLRITGANGIKSFCVQNPRTQNRRSWMSQFKQREN